MQTDREARGGQEHHAKANETDSTQKECESPQFACIAALICDSFLQRNVLRAKIIEYQQKKHKNDDSSLWSDIGDVVHILNGNGRNTGDGGSEDESDVEEGSGRKIVRVLGRDWINKAIPRLMHAVDTYAQDSLERGRSSTARQRLVRTRISRQEHGQENVHDRSASQLL